MADLSVQFHATREEILALLTEFLDEVGAHVSRIRFQPFDVAEIERAAVPAAVSDASVRRIVLTMTPPRLVDGEMNEFLDHNPNALLLDVGRQSEAGLKESWLTARASSSEDLSIWRKFAKMVRSATQTGVTAVNPETGATVKMREHRFTPGAERLERAGIPMLPVAGAAVLKFGKRS